MWSKVDVFVLKKELGLYIINKIEKATLLVEVDINGYSIIEKGKGDSCKVEKNDIIYKTKTKIVLEAPKLIGELLNSNIYYFSKIGLINNDNVEWQALLHKLYISVFGITGARNLTEEAFFT